jgi:DNA modification methylase
MIKEDNIANNDDFLENIKASLVPGWKLQKKRWGHSIHTMCTYMAAFPQSIPRYFIDLFTEKGDVVFDPFSGKGTTPAEALIMGRKGIGNDLNPLAYVLTNAKLNSFGKDETIIRLNELEREWIDKRDEIDIKGEPEIIRLIFHNKTLNQLIFLKNKLNWKPREGNNLDCFIIGNLMGIIHGSSKGFLSLAMPNTFSMSPNYIKNYSKKNNLVAEERDVFELLKSKLERIYKFGELNENGKSYLGDARKVPLESNSVNLIVTSPPYLKVIKYGLYNWIRLWFLDEKPEKVDSDLDDTHALKEYLEFMKESLKESYRIMKDGSLAVFIIGDVEKKRKKINLAKEVWDYCGKGIGFSLLEIMEDKISDNSKLTRIWKEKKGKATSVDRLLIMYKGNPPKFINKEIDWNF